MFISKAELKSATVIEVVNRAINLDDTIVDQIVVETEDLMRSYLSGRFDADAIFSATEADRNGVVLKHFKKIVVDEIYRRKTGGINEVTEKGHDEAMAWLEGVAKGMIPANDLPAKVDPPVEGDGFIKFGGNTRYNSIF